MNAHAGIRHGRCQTRRCTCSRYSWGGNDGRPCDCGHPQRWHAQVERPLVTYRGWSPEAS